MNEHENKTKTPEQELLDSIKHGLSLAIPGMTLKFKHPELPGLTVTVRNAR
jgi:hypothetical protein